MKNLKRILAVVLVAIMLVGTVPFVSAANVTFTDVSGHWAWTAGQIPYLAEKGVINGIKQSNGTYKFEPDSPVTRAQFIKMLVETFGLTETADINYNDIKSTDWFYPYFRKAAGQGFLLNYGKNVNPNGYLPREEAVALIMRYLNLPASEKASENTFTDYSTINSYYRLDVLQAVEAGIINGIKQSNGTYKFEPQKSLTRAEALTVIYKAVGCIYSTSTSGRDNASYKQNSIITKSGVTVSNATLTGRHLITEGASSGKVTLTNSKLTGTLYVRGGTELVLNNTDVDTIIVYGGGKVTFQNGSEVGTLTLEKTSEINLTSGSIGELNVKVQAPNVKISGNGTIGIVNIAAGGFNSAMVPEKYEIASGLTAMFAAMEFEGSSNTANAFLTTPYATSDGDYYAVNVTAGVTGTIRLYYTNSATTPTASEFETIYAGSQFTDSFSVSANQITCNNTFPASSVGKYKYVVVQLVSGPTKYAPVVISNTVLVGNGFTSAPALSGTTTVKYTAESTGKIYWFYSDSGVQLNQAEFLEEYADKESAFKGTISSTAGKSGTLTLKSTYLNNYPFIIFMASNSTGVYYTPCVLATGDTDFVKEPKITAAGTISFTPSISGDIYYYFSEKADIPSADDYYDAYKAAYYRGNKEAEKNVESSFTFNTRYSERYPYMIFALRNEDGDFSTPVAVYANYSTGITKGPTVQANGKILLQTEENGQIRYYYSTTDVVPTAEEFLTIYNETSKSYKGSSNVNGGSNIYISYNSSYTKTTPYMVIMFTGPNGEKYYPVVVTLKQETTSTAGFINAPAYNSKTKTIDFTVRTDGEVYYYFTNNNTDVVTTEAFYTNWIAASGSYGHAYAGQANSIAIDDATLATYKYVVLSFSATDELEGLTFTTPYSVVLTASAPSAPGVSDGIGFSYEINSGFIFIIAKEAGTLYSYSTNNESDLPKGDFASAYAVIPNSNKSSQGIAKDEYAVVTMDKDDKYLVICFKNSTKYYEYLVIDTSAGGEFDDNTKDTTGIQQSNAQKVDMINDHKFTFTATVSGTMYAYVTAYGNTYCIDSITVEAGGTYSIDFDAHYEALKESQYTTGTAYLSFQIVDGETKYKTHTVEASVLP